MGHDRSMRSLSNRTVRLDRNVVYALTAGVMALMGSLCSTAAFAAGVQSIDVLAIFFAMGAAGSLVALIVWYLGQLRTA